MAKIIWLPEALDDIERMYDFLVEKNPAAARNAVLCIKAAAHQLRNFPEIGRRMDEDTDRREVFAAFGAGAYVIRYRLSAASEVVVIRVWHSREFRN